MYGPTRPAPSSAPAQPARVAATLAFFFAAAACSTPSPSPTPALPDPASAKAAPAPPAPRGDWPPIDPHGTSESTEDGVGVINVTLDPPEREGEVTWIPPYWQTLDVLPKEISDGQSLYFATSQDQGSSDVLVRAGRLRSNVIAKLAGGSVHPGGCGAAARGTLLLSAPSDGGPSL